jgi:hypothetical protein
MEERARSTNVAESLSRRIAGMSLENDIGANTARITMLMDKAISSTRCGGHNDIIYVGSFGG